CRLTSLVFKVRGDLRRDRTILFLVRHNSPPPPFSLFVKVCLSPYTKKEVVLFKTTERRLLDSSQKKGSPEWGTFFYLLSLSTSSLSFWKPIGVWLFGFFGLPEFACVGGGIGVGDAVVAVIAVGIGVGDGVEEGFTVVEPCPL